MIKRIQESFSLKIFFITAALLVFSNLLVLMGLYAFMPQIYTLSYNDHVNTCVEELEETLPKIRRKESGKFFNDLCEKYQMRMDISAPYTKEKVEIPGLQSQYLCQDQQKYSLQATGAVADGRTSVRQYSYSIENNRSRGMEGEKIESCMVTLSFSDQGPYEFTLIPTEANRVNIFLSDLERILPYLLSIIFLLAFGASAVYTRYITGPVLGISRAAKAMSRMDWTNSRLFFKRKDEIGSLARSIDSTSKALEQALSERDDANKKLQAELEKQKKLDQEQQEFFAAASHELKTPVTVLKGQLTGMLYQVGAYQDRELYLKKSLRTVEEMEHRILKILGDPKLLKSALENLLENAVKYSPPGEEIRISAQKESEESKLCRLAVENTGVWIPEEKIPRLFQPFYRVDGSRNKETGGSGLGLYLVKKALELQEIPYKAENTEGGFCICLRLKRDSSETGGISECTNGSY